MDIIAYAYEADLHCIDCALKRFKDKLYDDIDPPVDDEDNVITPVFSTDQISFNNCGDCFKELTDSPNLLTNE